MRKLRRENKRFKMRALGFFILLLLTTNAFADSSRILEGATVTSVSSITGNTNAFWIKHTGGTGECATTDIKFKESDAGHPDIFQRTYAAAVTALATNLKINVHRYAGDDCAGVSIELRK